MEIKLDLTEVKKINGLAKQDLTHEGDLIINGDVGMCTLTVKNGTLTIHGKVNEGANITCSDPDAKNISQNSGRNSTTQINSEKISYSNQSWDYNGSYYIDASVVTPNINIDTPDRLEKREIKHPYGWVEDTLYIITPREGSSQAKAIVDGKQYYGTCIRVFSKTKKVIVEGALSSNNDYKPKKPCKVIINGDIGDSVVLKFDDLEFNGNVGSFCDITSEVGGFTAKNIGEGTKINVKGEIKVASVGKKVELKTDKFVSSMDIGELATIISNYSTVNVGIVGNGATIEANKNITADSLESNSKLTSEYGSVEIKGAAKDKVEIKANKSVDCMDIGNESTITSGYSWISAKKIGSGSMIQANKDIVAGDVGSNSDLTSSYGNIEITGSVHEKVSIKANKEVTCQNVGKKSSITSEYSKVRVKNVGSGVTITANKDITAGSVGSKSNLSSAYGEIEITGPCENSIKIKANKAIACQDVGEKSQITSEYGKVKVNNLESDVTIKANKDIDVKGYCPADASLKSDYGKVYKNSNVKKPEPVKKVEIKKESLTKEVISQAELEQIQEAIRLSTLEANKNHACSQQGFFKPQVEQKMEHKVEKKVELEREFPAEFYCPITMEIMQNPVICMDGHTYEETAIKNWLKNHDTSPKTNLALPSKLLIPNNSLHTMIQEALEKKQETKSFNA